MAQRKRAWKLQDFVAHSANVTSLALGHKSGRVMVTGGEDRKVNLWAVGKFPCIMSLTGHTTTIESVRFGHKEEMVVAGSLSGALKVWNLEEAKIMRTLTGHKASIRSLDFHPYGGYIASGSMDCNVKLWDIRRKGCIYTYKGHSGCVNCLRFSPDGRWVATAGDDGLVKLWDLTAGRLLTDLKMHKAAVNAVEFHPNELLLASGSTDRTIKFWDLETFQVVSSTDGDSSPIRCLSFQADGQCVFSGSKDMLKVYGWEPARCFDSVIVNWGDVADISVTQNQLIGATYSQTNVQTYVVDLQMVQLSSSAVQATACQSSNSLSGSRKNFVTERPPTQSSRQARAPVRKPQRRSQICIPKEESEEPVSEKQPEESAVDDGQSLTDINNPEDYRALFQPNSRLAHSPPRNVEPFRPPPEDEPEPVKQRAVPPARQPVPVSALPPPGPKVAAPSAPMARDGVAAEDFLPKAALVGDGRRAGSESDVLASIEKGHTAMVTVMSARGRNLQIVRAMWTSGNTKTAVDSAISMNDPAVMVDILNVLNTKTSLWTLDLSSAVLPQCKELLNSKYESYVTTSCNCLKIILRNMGPVIKANMTAPPSIGVDISREERHRKCNACYITLSSIRNMLEKRQNVEGKLGKLFREVVLQIAMLD